MFSHVKKIQVNSALILSLKNKLRRNCYGLGGLSTGAAHLPIGLCGNFTDCTLSRLGLCRNAHLSKSRVLMLCATVEAFVTLNFAGRMTSRGQKSCAKWRRVLFEIISLHEARLGCTKISVHKCECSSHKVWRSFFCLYTYMPYELSENHWSYLLQTSDEFPILERIGCCSCQCRSSWASVLWETSRHNRFLLR